MLRKLAIWYLRKRNCSVLINYIVNEDSIKQKTSDAYIYDNHFGKDALYLDDKGEIFDVPYGSYEFKVVKD